ncbi:MAG: tRNA (adenosine(37)-N6)-dimethylallyltransferase MiaA [Gammaproteobacteria bacterium]|nr:tRNA (adenosine(37)-N6)-dimethylallyltransferase MiaA [Gammaproteobacteria bacterium]MCY4255753.1 tRNA (adenosine(37)-N6)-dimethylallyltransferase MiaA [Gammaproteobacteria bacterium]MCY4340876.1 tRNA (adenosine(37)-N6)-dimethylallyltransferase MiaA [Gammaproteobacteria bacterium]
MEAVLLKGPTCVGKTRLVVRLSERLPLRIISVDSACVYRGLDIGTAKPAAEEQRAAPHRLVDICSPRERYSAARFAEDARREIARAKVAGRIPLLVGGAMLYFRALERGFAEMPGANSAVRRRIRMQAAADGWPALHVRLKALDPAAADRLSPNDAARIERALEVLELTGRSISSHWPGAPRAAARGYLKFALLPGDREAWRRHIEQRFHGMLERGWLEEAQALRLMRLDPGLPATRIAGYRQLLEHLDGRYPLAEAVARGIRATKALGRRQLTWLRAEADIERLTAEAPRCDARLESAIRAHWKIGRGRFAQRRGKNMTGSAAISRQRD